MSKATLYPIVPEICQECPDGLAWMTCYDGKYRCLTCVHRHAEERGWDKVPERLQPAGKTDLPPLPQPSTKAEEKIYQTPKMF